MERNLLGFGEVIRGIAVQRELADQLHRRQLLRHDLGRVEQIDALERVGPVVGHHLDAELVLQRRSGLDAVGHVTAVEVGIAPRGDLRLLPDQRVDAGDRLPVELHQARPALGVDEAEGVNAETLHGAVRARDPPIAHVPHDVVGGLGVQRDEIPEGVVGRLRLRDLAVGVGLAGVDHVRELDAVLDEEHRDVVADEVEHSFVGVELHGEPARVANGVSRPARAENGREAAEDIGLLALRCEERSACHRLGGSVGLEHAVGRRAARVHDALRDALVVEVGDLLAEVEVLQQRRPAVTGLE